MNESADCGMMMIGYFIETTGMRLIDYYVLTSQFPANWQFPA
jgi:hypothetical protein